jgi:hypothetical protein
MGIDQGELNCALCACYTCDGCPVGKKTRNSCGKTPYHKFYTYVRDCIKCVGDNYCDEAKAIAKKERMFLKGLKRRHDEGKDR